MDGNPQTMRDELALILTPTGRDATLAAGILRDRGIRAWVCTDITDFCAQIAAGCGAAILAEEAIDPSSARKLLDTLSAQLPWSDLPLIVLASNAEQSVNYLAMAVLRQRGNVTILERPLRILTLVSGVQSALRARRRQYEVRDLLAETRNAVRQRDQFLAMLGHELRNPLGAINSALSVLNEAQPPQGEIEYEQRGIIRRQTDHLSRLVDDLLDVSRITSGKIVLQRKIIDLCDVARSSVEVARVAAIANQHELTLTLECDCVPVDADPVRMEQVVSNLLTNAIKYTPNGGKINVTVAADDGHAILRVRDTGIGMSKELLPRVFELFTQSERALDRSQGGLGIGLTLVRSLIEMHDGQVTAHSEGPNAGSEFVITLPRSITVHAPPPAGQSGAVPREAPPRAVASASSRNGHAHPPGRKVLIIEDQPDARRALQRLLQIWGHQVEVASDGPGGVEAATKSNPDIALVDVGLPGLDGYEVARRIRKNLGQHVRLVALTGYGQPEDKERALAAGFDLHLVKPVDSEQLAQSVGPSR